MIRSHGVIFLNAHCLPASTLLVVYKKTGFAIFKIVAPKLNKLLDARSLEATNSRIPLEYCPSLTCSKLKLINDSEGYHKIFIVRPIMPLFSISVAIGQFSSNWPDWSGRTVTGGC